MLSVITGRDWLPPGDNPISARIGPTGEAYLTPKPGVTAPLLRGRSGLVFWVTNPASTNPAPIRLPQIGKRASTLPSTTKFPPSGRGSKSRSLRLPALGSHCVTSAPLTHAAL